MVQPIRCDASWLSRGAAAGNLATRSRRRSQKRRHSSDATSLSCCSREPPRPGAAPRNRIWVNPERRRRGLRSCEPFRRWVEARDFPSLVDSGGGKFVLVSYNILGDCHAANHPDLYSNIPPDVMRWESRRRQICQEISKWNADLVCLQEVDRYHDILSIIKKEGYTGSYKRRTGEAKDGCAIFWKEESFRLLEGESIEFAAFGLRDNVAQVFAFETNEIDPRRVVIGNIHVLFNPKRGDIKLGQVRLLLSKAYALSEKWGNIPVVLAGDFNSTPESAIYRFLSTSELDLDEHDRRHLSGQEMLRPILFELPGFLDHDWTNEELKNATGSPECTKVSHPLKLHSSYASVKVSNARIRGSHGEPLATSYHSKFLGTVDYLWYSTGLASMRVLDTLPIDTLRKLGGLPHKDIGSDHLALISEFIFTDCKPTKSEETDDNSDNSKINSHDGPPKLRKEEGKRKKTERRGLENKSS